MRTLQKSQSNQGSRHSWMPLSRRAVIAISQATAVLVVPAMLIFTATILPAKSVSLTQLQEFDAVVQRASGFETYRLPAITSTVGHAGHFGQTGQQEKSVQMVVALGVAYVVLGGLVFALAASFRLLSDKVDSFFAPLIPKPTG